MKALKLVINGEEQEIPQGWWDGIGRTLYITYQMNQTWLYNGNSIDDIKNNVVLVFHWQYQLSMPTRIYDSDDNYIDITCHSRWNEFDTNWILLGIIKVENNTFNFYPRYWGVYSER